MKLCISVEFLDKYHGTIGEAASWPPDPYRLFQAIVSANAAGRESVDPDAAVALRWMESAPPPVILANPPAAQETWRRYVPNNDLVNDASALRNEQRNASVPKEYSPQVPDGPLHYIWDVEDAPADSLSKAVGRIPYLGRSSDNVLCECKVVSDAEYEKMLSSGIRKHIPLDHSAIGLRLPVVGSFDRLLHIHDAADGSKQLFSRIRYSEFGEQRPFAPFMLRTLSGGTAEFNCLDACKVSSRLRGAVISWAGQYAYEFPGDSDRFVAGHAPKGQEEPLKRFSYVPLPSIGNVHAGGNIRRVLIAAPAGCENCVAWADRNGHGKLIHSDDLQGKVVAKLDRMDPKDKVLSMYIGPSSTWASVLPVVLPANDRGSNELAAKMAMDCFRQAGVGESDVVDFELRKDSFVAGGKHAKENFFLPKHHVGKSIWHMKVRFSRNVCGPVFFGSARHGGLGVFATL